VADFVSYVDVFRHTPVARLSLAESFDQFDPHGAGERPCSAGDKASKKARKPRPPDQRLAALARFAPRSLVRDDYVPPAGEVDLLGSVQRAVDGGELTLDGAAEAIVAVVGELGLRPVGPPPLPEPIGVEDLGVVCWMTVLPAE